MGHAAFGALGGATVAVLGWGGQLLRARYQRSLVALKGAALLKRREATAAEAAANLAEGAYVKEKAADADRRGREEMAKLQRRQQEQRAAEGRLQQQQQNQETEMEDLGAAASPSTNHSTSGASNGELT